MPCIGVVGAGKSVKGEICKFGKVVKSVEARGRSGPNGVASSNFVVKGAQVEIHSDRLVTSKIDTNLVDFRKIKYKWTPNKAKQNRLYVSYILLSIYVPVSRIKYA